MRRDGRIRHGLDPGRTIGDMRAKLIGWTLVVLALIVGGQAIVDRYRLIGQPFAGFMVLENLFVAAGGAERGGLEPFDIVRAMNGQLIDSGRNLQAEVARHPVGTTFHYLLYRGGQLVEADVTTRVYRYRDFRRFLVEGLLVGLLTLALGALVLYLQPGTDTPHPAETSAEIEQLAPNLEVQKDWRGPTHLAESIRRVTDFLTRHTP